MRIRCARSAFSGIEVLRTQKLAENRSPVLTANALRKHPQKRPRFGPLFGPKTWFSECAKVTSNFLSSIFDRVCGQNFNSNLDNFQLFEIDVQNRLILGSFFDRVCGQNFNSIPAIIENQWVSKKRPFLTPKFRPQTRSKLKPKNGPFLDLSIPENWEIPKPPKIGNQIPTANAVEIIAKNRVFLESNSCEIYKNI